MDAGGLGSASLQALRTPVDTHGHGLDIYGSEGWGFESLRACDESLVALGVSAIAASQKYSASVT
jgi:hypothetical protein